MARYSIDQYYQNIRNNTEKCLIKQSRFYLYTIRGASYQDEPITNYFEICCSLFNWEMIVKFIKRIENFSSLSRELSILAVYQAIGS